MSPLLLTAMQDMSRPASSGVILLSCGPCKRSSVVAGGPAAGAGASTAEDVVARRTRAQQSLLDYNLEDLEAMLQLGAEDAKAEEDAEYEAFIQVGHLLGHPDGVVFVHTLCAHMHSR